MTTALSVRHVDTKPTYTFNQQPIRVFLVDNQPWFAAVDICNALCIQNPTMAIQKLDEDERMQVIDSSTLNSIEGTQINNLLNVVSESGMNALVLRCRDAMTKGTPAHAFRKWVTSEVLPSIRKTGSYISAPMTAPQTISTKQYQELEHIVDIMANVMNALPQAKKHLWNIIRFETNVENVGKLPVSEYHRAKALLTDMHEQVFHDLKPFLQSIVSDYLRNHLARGIPSTSELKRQWYSEYQTGLPQPLNWKEVTKQLEAHQ